MAKRTVTFQKGDVVSILSPDLEEGYEYFEVFDVLNGSLFCRSFLSGDDKVIPEEDVYERFDRIRVGETEVLRFLRHETVISDLARGEYPYERLICRPPVDMRTADLLEALRSIRALDGARIPEELMTYTDALARLELQIYEFESGEPAPTDFRGLTIGEDLDELFAEIVCYPISDDLQKDAPGTLDDWIGQIEAEIERHALPPEERTCSVQEKERYISRFSNAAQNLELASDRELALYKRFVDELCGEGNVLAMREKAYAFYGGNRAYPCDWTASRDLLEQLFRKTEDPFVPNTLGYLCYYGRCSGGEPDYEKAFYYFSIGAAAGVTESRYKLADMFLAGQAVPKNLSTARDILTGLYEEMQSDPIEEVADSKLADVAFRVGQLYESGTADEEPDPVLACIHYLEADFAIRARRRLVDAYGDESVENRIRESLERIQKELTDPEEELLPDAMWIVPILHRNGPARFSISRDEDGYLVRFVPDPDSDTVRQKFFVTFPEIGFCGFLPSITIRADRVAVPGPDATDYEGTADRAELLENVLYLLDGHHPVLSISGDPYFVPPKDKAKRECRFAVVTGSGDSQRTLVRCPSGEIRAGDPVEILDKERKRKGVVYRCLSLSRTELAREESDYPAIRKLKN